jgi:hypothetical protein
VTHCSVAIQHFRIVTSVVRKTEPDYAVASAGVCIVRRAGVKLGARTRRGTMLGIVTPKQIRKAMSIAAACSSLRTEATFVCRASITAAAFRVWRAATYLPHPPRSRRTKVSRLLLRRHQPLKSIASHPAVRPEALRTSAHEAAMSYGEALARHGGTDWKFRQACD